MDNFLFPKSFPLNLMEKISLSKNNHFNNLLIF